MNTAVEHFDYGIERHWFDDRRIVMIRTHGEMSRAAVDTWAELILDTVKQWPEGRPVCILHDLSSPYQALTPYSRKRAEETYDYVEPEREVFIAIAIPPGVIHRLVSVFFVRRPARTLANVRQQMFTSYDQGLAWLREMTKSAGNGS